MNSPGQEIMEFIIYSKLFSVECPDAPESGCLTVWSANAAEQLDALFNELKERSETTHHRN